MAGNFAFPDRITPDITRQIRTMKARIEAERIPPGEDPDFHFKLGRGGLVDVEFLTQLIQMRSGATMPSLRAQATLEAVRGAVSAELLGFDEVGSGGDKDSNRPINVHAPAAGSTVTLTSTDPLAEFYIAGAIVTHRQIQLSGGDHSLDLEWSGYLETIDGPIILDLGTDGHLKGDLTAGGVGGNVILHADETLAVSGHIMADGEILVTGGVDAAGVPTTPSVDTLEISVELTKTAWLRTTPDPAPQTIRIEGLQQDVLLWFLGSGLGYLVHNLQVAWYGVAFQLPFADIKNL